MKVECEVCSNEMEVSTNSTFAAAYSDGFNKGYQTGQKDAAVTYANETPRPALAMVLAELGEDIAELTEGLRKAVNRIGNLEMSMGQKEEYSVENVKRKCGKWINAGPGHQSRHDCDRDTPEPHHHHWSRLYGHTWSDCQAVTVDWSDEKEVFTDIFDNPPGECEVHDDNGDLISPWEH